MPWSAIGTILVQADLLAHQTYWAGGDYHVTIQTSDCRGVPLVMSKDKNYALFRVQNLDEACSMLALLSPGGWVTFLVPWLHSIVTVVLIIQGIVVALFHTASSHYLPRGLRAGKERPWLRFFMPFMQMITQVTGNERMAITFKGSLIMASDTWMTHWLYMWLSILDAVVNLRATYVILQVSASLLIFEFTAGNLIFMCGALIKITWLMCLVQTLVRAFMKLTFRALCIIRSHTREKLEWTINGISILLSNRVYYVLLFIINVTLIKVKGDPSFMKRAMPYTVGVYGGVEKLAGFWGADTDLVIDDTPRSRLDRCYNCCISQAQVGLSTLLEIIFSTTIGFPKNLKISHTPSPRPWRWVCSKPRMVQMRARMLGPRH